MAAPDFPTLYDFETQIESAWSAYLTTNSVTNVIRRGATTLATPRVELMFTTGSATGSMHPFTTSGYKPRPDRFGGTLSLRVVTTRKGTAASHSTYRGQVRAFVSDFMRVQTTDNLPYLWIFDIMDGATNESVEAEQHEDISELIYNLKFGIRSDAWPIA